MKISVMFTGRSYQTGGQLPSEVEVSDGTQVSELLELLQRLLPDGQQLPPTCLVAVAGRHVGTVQQLKDQPLHDGAEVTLIAPVAGG